MVNSIQDKVCRHIAFISDDNYILPTCVAIKSLVLNVSSDDVHYYKIHIFSFSLMEESRQKLRSMASENSEVLIHCIEKNTYKKLLDSINQNTHVTPTALLKFELCNLLPEVEELLYLDGDIIINGNITDIFDYDISDYLLAASFEFWTYLSKLYQFNNDDEIPDFSFNSGVMLLNLKRFRELKIDKKLWEVKFEQCNQKDKKENMMDQDTFNIVCASKCLHLPIRFNCNNQFTDGVSIELINKAYGTYYENATDLLNDAVIIHYVGKKDKPWLYQGMRCQKIWDEYCEKAGIEIRSLNRKKFKKTFLYYISRLRRSLEVRGVRKSILYLFSKREIKL